MATPKKSTLYYYNHPWCAACCSGKNCYHRVYTQVPIEDTYIETYIKGDGCCGSYETRERNIHEGAFLAAIRDKNLAVVKAINSRQKFSGDAINRMYSQMDLLGNHGYLSDLLELTFTMFKYFIDTYADFVSINKENLCYLAFHLAFPNVCHLSGCGPIGPCGRTGPIGKEDHSKEGWYTRGNEKLLIYLRDLGYLTEAEKMKMERCREEEKQYHS